MVLQVLKVLVSLEHIIKPNDLVIVHKGALTYSMTGNLKHNDNVLGLVLKLVQPRKERSKFIKERVNFDNAALYYVLTSKGCLTVFEFDLEVIDEKEQEEASCC
jgi:hypothetical protein